MSQEYKLYRSCVDHSQSEVYKLHDMIDSAREITFKTFAKHCDWKPFAETIYAIGSQKGLHLKDDWSVSFYKSKYNGKKCYYMKHSSIEYIYLKRD